MLSLQGCAVTKGCFGSDGTCVEDGSCKILVTYQLDKSSGKTKMLLHGKDIPVGKYIAVGLSEDASMGSDLVIWGQFHQYFTRRFYLG